MKAYEIKIDYTDTHDYREYKEEIEKDFEHDEDTFYLRMDAFFNKLERANPFLKFLNGDSTASYYKIKDVDLVNFQSGLVPDAERELLEVCEEE